MQLESMKYFKIGDYIKFIGPFKSSCDNLTKNKMYKIIGINNKEYVPGKNEFIIIDDLGNYNYFQEYTNNCNVYKNFELDGNRLRELKLERILK